MDGKDLIGKGRLIAGIIFLVFILLGVITKKITSFNTISKCLIFIVIGVVVYEIYRILHKE